MLDINLRPKWALTFLIESSFLVFSTNKNIKCSFASIKLNWKWKFLDIENKIGIFKLNIQFSIS